MGGAAALFDRDHNRRALVRLLLIASTGGALAFACLRPTQITVQLSTDVDCATIATNAAALYGANPGEGAIATTRACDARSSPHVLGTLVLTPSGDKDGKVAIVAVAGVRRPTEECPESGYKGCIVARRRMRFDPHEPLSLPIEMLSTCLDIPCSEEETCFRGACVSADVVAKDGCLGPDCEGSAGAGDLDGAIVSDSASNDASVGDAPNVDDAPFIGDAGVPMRVLVPATSAGRIVRGLAKDGQRLVWIENGNPTDSVCEVLVAPGASAPVCRALPSVGTARGIATKDGRRVIAGTFSGNSCGYELPADGGAGTTLQCGVLAGMIGIGANWSAGAFMFANMASAYVWPSGTAYGLAGGGYVESDSAFAAFAGSGGLFVFDWLGQSLTTLNAPTPDGRGFAIGPQHWFIATSGGAIFVVRRDDARFQGISLPRAFTSMEDILYDDVERTLYIAGDEGAGSNIYALGRLDPTTFP